MGYLQRLISGTPKIATNYLVLSGAEFISKILTAVSFAYLGRVLGPQIYGYLEFALAIALIGTLLVDFGLSSIGAREIAKDAGKTSGLFLHITSLRLILALITIAIIVILTSVINQPPSVKYLILLFGFSIIAVPLLIQWVFQGLDLMHFVALASLLRWSIYTAGIFTFVRNFDDVWIIPLIEAVAILCVGIFLGSVYLRTIGIPKQGVDIRYGLQILRKAAPIGASELVWAVKVYFATITLGLIISGPALGWFTSAHRIVISLHAFVWLYFYNLLPSISRTSQQAVSDYQRLIKNSLKITTWAVIFIGIMGTVYSKVVINIFYGDQYSQSVGIFQILVWLIPLTMVSGHFRYSLIGYDFQKKEFISAVIGAVMIIILNVLLIPRFGYSGAAWAIILSEFAILLSAWLFANRLIAPLSFLSQIWQPITAGIVTVLLLFLLIPINIWVAGLIAAFVYGLFFLFFYPALISKIRALMAHDQISQA